MYSLQECVASKSIVSDVTAQEKSLRARAQLQLRQCRIWIAVYGQGAVSQHYVSPSPTRPDYVNIVPCPSPAVEDTEEPLLAAFPEQKLEQEALVAALNGKVLSRHTKSCHTRLQFGLCTVTRAIRGGECPSH